jgi:hypothetical protein
MNAHFRSTWNFCHLYVIISAVVRVVWRRFCGGLDWPGPELEEDALCSETPDEDALIRSRRWILLSIQQTKGISAYQGNLTGGRLTGSKRLFLYRTGPCILLQTKFAPPLSPSVLLAKEISASIVLSTNAATAHEVAKVQPETRMRSSIRSTPSLFSCVQANQLATWSRM